MRKLKKRHLNRSYVREPGTKMLLTDTDAFNLLTTTATARWEAGKQTKYIRSQQRYGARRNLIDVLDSENSDVAHVRV